MHREGMSEYRRRQIEEGKRYRREIFGVCLIWALVIALYAAPWVAGLDFLRGR